MDNYEGKKVVKIKKDSWCYEISFTDGYKLIITAVEGMDDSSTYPELEYEYIS